MPVLAASQQSVEWEWGDCFTTLSNRLHLLAQWPCTLILNFT
jgi:hypothetical protein